MAIHWNIAIIKLKYTLYNFLLIIADGVLSTKSKSFNFPLLLHEKVAKILTVAADDNLQKVLLKRAVNGYENVEWKIYGVQPK